MTPMQKVGLKVGDKIRAGESVGEILPGMVIEIIWDDGSDMPPVKLPSGDEYYYLLTRDWEKVTKKEFKAMKFRIESKESKLYEKVCSLLEDLGYEAETNIPAHICNIVAYESGKYAAWGHGAESFKSCGGEEINIDGMREEHIELESKIVEVVVNRLQVHFSIEEPKEYKPKVGDFVTVVRWINKTDKSYTGNVLEIKAIDYPFIVTERHTGWFRDKALTLSLDQVEIKPLTDKFVAAAMIKKDS